MDSITCYSKRMIRKGPRSWPWLSIILVIGLSLRLYRIDLPLLTRAADRELLTADITKGLYVDHFDWLHLRQFSDPQHLPYVLEFPTFNLLVAGGYFLTGGVHEVVGRLISVIASVATLWLVYRLILSYFSKTVALAASALMFLVSPVALWMSRSFQPDSVMVMLAVAAVYCSRRWQQERGIKWCLFSAICLLLAGLTKLPVFYIALPIFFVQLQLWGKTWWRQPLFWSYWICVLLPLLSWYFYGIATSSGRSRMFFEQHGAGQLPSVSLDFYRPLLGPTFWINNLYHFSYEAATLAALPFFWLGLLLTIRKRFAGIFWVWLLAGGLSFLAIPGITQTHYYYFYSLIPPAAVFVGIGFEKITRSLRFKDFWGGRWALLAGLIVLPLLSTRTVLVKEYRIEPSYEHLLEFAALIQRQVPEGKTLLTSAAPLPYYSNRPAYLIDFGDDLWGPVALDRIKLIERYRTQGAEYIAIDRGEVIDRDPVLREYFTRFLLLTSFQENYRLYFLRV